MWVIPTPLKMTPPTPDGRHQPPSTYRIEMGLTSHGLRDIGDVTSIRPATPKSVGVPRPIRVDEPLLLLDWEGYAITSADELYHAVWENDEGVHEVTSPLAGEIEEIASLNPSREGIDDTDVLAVVVSKREELEQVARGWVGEDEYLKFLQAEGTDDESGGVRAHGKAKFTPVEGGWSG